MWGDESGDYPSVKVKILLRPAVWRHPGCRPDAHTPHLRAGLVNAVAFAARGGSGAEASDLVPWTSYLGP